MWFLVFLLRCLPTCRRFSSFYFVRSGYSCNCKCHIDCNECQCLSRFPTPHRESPLPPALAFWNLLTLCVLMFCSESLPKFTVLLANLARLPRKLAGIRVARRGCNQRKIRNHGYESRNCYSCIHWSRARAHITGQFNSYLFPWHISSVIWQDALWCFWFHSTRTTACCSSTGTFIAVQEDRRLFVIDV
jgi:hypothetical protein